MSVRKRVALTIADQAVSSGSNFVVALFVARLAGPGGFGTFALAYTIWLAVAGVHRALITDPLIMSTRHGDGSADLHGSLAAEITLGFAALVVVSSIGGVLIVVGAAGLGKGLLALAPWLVFLLVQDFWRWIAFMRRQPGKALINDIVFTIVQLVVLAALVIGGHRGPSAALGAWGVGAGAGSLLGTWQFGVRPRLKGSVSYFRESWPNGRWLLADFATYYGSGQAYFFMVAGLLGPASLGVLRAGLNLMGPTHVLLQAGGSFGLAESVGALRERGWTGLDAVVKRMSAFAIVGVGAYAVLIWALSAHLMGWVYGRPYAAFGNIASLGAASYVIGAGILGPNLGVMAAWRTRALFVARLITAAASFSLVGILAPRFGVLGAAWSGVGIAAVNTALVWFAYLRVRAEGRREDLFRPDTVRARASEILEVRIDSADTASAVGR